MLFVRVTFIIIMCIRRKTHNIYIYREDFAQQYGKCGARSGSPQLNSIARYWERAIIICLPVRVSKMLW